MKSIDHHEKTIKSEKDMAEHYQTIASIEIRRDVDGNAITSRYFDAGIPRSVKAALHCRDAYDPVRDRVIYSGLATASERAYLERLKWGGS